MQTQTLNIALPKELVRKVDKVAEKEYRNRSELIREALRLYLVKIEKWDRIFEVGQKAVRKMGIKNERELNGIVYEFRHGRKQA